MGNSLGSQATFPARDYLLGGKTPVEVLGLHLIHAVLQHEIIRSARCLAQRATRRVRVVLASLEVGLVAGTGALPSCWAALCASATVERPKALGHGARPERACNGQ